MVMDASSGPWETNTQALTLKMREMAGESWNGSMAASTKVSGSKESSKVSV